MRITHYPIVFVAILSGAVTARAADAPAPGMPCVEVQIGQDSSSHMKCVNEALRQAVQHEHNAPLVQPPVTAQSSSNKVGTFNDAAARQMMGNAYGVSSQPQRPKNTFTSPLLHLPH
jgi:hypothetical protein